MAATKSTAKKAAHPATAEKAKSSKQPANYTKPELRERLKNEIKAGEKGGRAGQWSARKAQLLTSEYEKHGGGYKKSTRTTAQKHLEAWTDEKWRTADGKKAARGKTTARYLPDEAWDKMTPAQRKATDKKKQTKSKTGEQFVANTPAAKRARKSVAKS